MVEEELKERKHNALALWRGKADKYKNRFDSKTTSYLLEKKNGL